MEYTTIQIGKSTRKALAGIKQSRRETYDEVIHKLLALIPAGDDEGEYTDEFRVELLNARLDLERGNTISHDVVKKQVGL